MSKPKTIAQMVRESTTRRERILDWLDYRTRPLRFRCRICGLKRPAHKFGCLHSGHGSLTITLHSPDGYFDR